LSIFRGGQTYILQIRGSVVCSQANRVRWRPDPIFMLDICEAEERFWLVEINGFSCSWLYACDLAAVVREASRLASECWKGTVSLRS
jgi:hypothetical protein